MFTRFIVDAVIEATPERSTLEKTGIHRVPNVGAGFSRTSKRAISECTVSIQPGSQQAVLVGFPPGMTLRRKGQRNRFDGPVFQIP